VPPRHGGASYLVCCQCVSCSGLSQAVMGSFLNKTVHPKELGLSCLSSPGAQFLPSPSGPPCGNRRKARTSWRALSVVLTGLPWSRFCCCLQDALLPIHGMCLHFHIVADRATVSGFRRGGYHLTAVATRHCFPSCAPTQYPTPLPNTH
jgi:hypothetical protein